MEVYNGTLTVKSCSLESNTVLGGTGGISWNAAGTQQYMTGGLPMSGHGGFGGGGGLYALTGTVHLTLDDMENNYAGAGFTVGGNQSGWDAGGGLYALASTLTMDSFTTAHIVNNFDSNNDAYNNVYNAV